MHSPSPPPTSDDGDYVDVVRCWPFARRIFGGLLDDRDFPVVYDVLRQTPNFMPEEWDHFKEQLQECPDILRHFWFRYDRTMKAVITGSPSALHRYAVQGCTRSVIDSVIKPVTEQYSLEGMTIMNGSELLVERKSVTVDLTTNLVLVESACTESYPHVMNKIKDNMISPEGETLAVRSLVSRTETSWGTDDGEDRHAEMQTEGR
ncbi:hypothetical protein B0H21DRAFT_302552 [Amylocystis lapponica]|nr:hypothetical protein B0H21DRAFT_302552 [Amylocystis lapponica]